MRTLGDIIINSAINLFELKRLEREKDCREFEEELCLRFNEDPQNADFSIGRDGHPDTLLDFEYIGFYPVEED